MESMNIFAKIGSFFNNTKIKIIFLNLFAIGLLLLLFEPTAKSDDYDMANLSFGGLDGEYSSILLYSNILFGSLLKGLMYLFPHIAWYYVVQYILLFGGFSIVTYIFVKRNDKKVALALNLFFLLIAGYEFYIRITFSKTSGLLIAAGYLLLLYLIDNNNTKIWKWLIAYFFVISGMLIRLGMFKAITLVFFSSFVIFCYKEFTNKSLNVKKKIGQFIIIVISLFMIQFGGEKLNAISYSTDEEWAEYPSINNIRGSLYDYGIPSYDLYAEEYQEIGISRNDYLMWFQLANKHDEEVFSLDKYYEIIQIRENVVVEEMPKSERIVKAVAGLLNYQKTNTMFYILLIAAVCFLLLEGKLFGLVVLSANMFCIIAYLYLSYAGRTQHHVDASVYMTGAIIILYFIDTKEKKYKSEIKKIILLTSLIVVFFINNFYNELISSSYYGTVYGSISSQKEQYEKNYDNLSLLSEDESHLYVISPLETNRLYPCFTVFEPIEKGFYHNIYRPNMNHIPVYENVLEDFGVENVWKEMTNNNNMSYIVSELRLSDIPIIQTYIQEHYAPNAESVLAKQVEDIYIYRFIDDTFTIDVSNVRDSSQVINSVEKNYDEVGNVRISGYAFIDGKDSFAQNIYIQAVNKKTGEYKIYTCLQTENNTYQKNDKYNGKYSAFSCTISKESLEASKLKKKNVEFNLLLEVENEIYQISID